MTLTIRQAAYVAERRRSDRLMLTVPLRARGVDAGGQPFDTRARAVVLSRHGAQVQIACALRAGQSVRLVNTNPIREADFRVVGPLSSPAGGGEYGVECLDAERDIWQIHFPPLSNGAAGDAKALLECRICHTVSLANLSLGDLDTLRQAGFVAKGCPTCRAFRPARYAEITSAKRTSDEDRWMSAFARLSSPRRHRRICLQMPLGVRDFQDGFEVTRTENVSRGGFCFTSEKDYRPGQEVMVVFPGEAVSRGSEVPAQIVWYQPGERTARKIYGMHCERPGD